MSRLRLLAVATTAGVVLALGGCGESAAPSSAAMASAVDSTLGLPEDMVRSATGPMDHELAAAATALPAPMLGKFLRERGFRAGYSRVWSARGELVTALGYRFGDAASATAFVGFVADRLATSRFHQPFSDSALPGSRGFSLVSKVRGTTQFCAGELVPVGVDALVVTRCAPYPVGPSLVTPLAQRAHATAVSS